MASFNLQTLYNFRPARYLCQNCLGLLMQAPAPTRDANPKCPVCSVEYVPSRQWSRHSIDQYLAGLGLELKFPNVLQHCMDLAATLSPLGFGAKPSQMRTLLGALSHAQAFVHFTSWGITEFFVGALKVVAQRVPVRGIVSSITEPMLDELTDLAHDVLPGNLEVMHFLRGDWSEEPPHQKLIVIDGLLAFKGSANLTHQSWRKAERGRDHVEVVTDVNEVVALHNKLFSPVWASRKIGTKRIETAEIPF